MKQSTTKRSHRIGATAGAILLLLAGAASSAGAADAELRQAVPDVSGTYVLVKRVLANGEVTRPPLLGGLFTLDHGWRNFNLYWTNKDGSIAGSESVVARYTLTAGQYCQTILFRSRLNGDQPGARAETPKPAAHCSRTTIKDGKVSFTLVDEGATLTFDANGFVATDAGHLSDYWKKLR